MPAAQPLWASPWPCYPLPSLFSDKPGQCPKVRPQLTSEPCTEEDDCLHDRDCPRQEKCCFSGCAMRCSRPAREHPGQCPRAEPCWDPRRRRRNQCLDDSVCGRDEKCCNTGCTWACVAVPRESSGGASRQCAEECETDAQCPQGQRCTHMGCSHVCVDIPGGRVGVCPIPRDAGTCLDLCSLDEECPWGQKCCSNGCGHVCMPASLEERDVAVVPQQGAGRCSERCDADTQCPQGKRCTRTSCGRVCMDMSRGREGECPIPSGSGTCLDLCSSDKECPQGQKCCNNGCGHVCTWIHDGEDTEGQDQLQGGTRGLQLLRAGRAFWKGPQSMWFRLSSWHRHCLQCEGTQRGEEQKGSLTRPGHAKPLQCQQHLSMTLASAPHPFSQGSLKAHFPFRCCVMREQQLC
uniref:WAP domain-containing protein n=1 Tax=Pavo cristatus TaxID=9049 RepID=A0A8C9EKV5_PAVCR